jgi:hypothetical protein
MGQFLPKIRDVSSYLVISEIERKPGNRKVKTRIFSLRESIRTKRNPLDKIRKGGEDND